MHSPAQQPAARPASDMQRSSTGTQRCGTSAAGGGKRLHLVPLPALPPAPAHQQQHALQLPRREGGQRAAVPRAQAGQQRRIALPRVRCRQDAHGLWTSNSVTASET